MPFIAEAAEITTQIEHALERLVDHYLCTERLPDRSRLVGRKVAERVEIHVLRHRAFPATLQQVYRDDPVPPDAWGQRWHYRPPRPRTRPWSS